ncbi:MAG: hypothetical protein LKF53_02380 [Solobacterium sp.]|jgi:hypothetical protein|nr:hypothetical protein [Solobacterium sp.]MCH4205224.1 hypothetical protein [Solobacterium sp.]MCH4226817.1 hypothetical protein [Solobacterium sp.]MCH4281577.1 hypothetical protein [Solobacterium sp.]
MHKIAKLILCCSLLAMSGCGKETNTADKADLEKYQTYYTAISENVTFASESTNFSCELEMTQVEDGSFRYYIVIDDPQSAMYDVIAMAVENDIPYDSADKMMPSIGIFDDAKSLIPGQVDSENGYVKGIALSGESANDTIQLKLLVQWTDKTKKTSKREYIAYTLNTDGIVKGDN